MFCRIVVAFVDAFRLVDAHDVPVFRVRATTPQLTTVECTLSGGRQFRSFTPPLCAQVLVYRKQDEVVQHMACATDDRDSRWYVALNSLLGPPR
jgi:hypothetical protein